MVLKVFKLPLLNCFFFLKKIQKGSKYLEGDINIEERDQLTNFVKVIVE